MVLGMDFVILFKIEVYATEQELRVKGARKKWNQLSNNDNYTNWCRLD